jgi:hypothetical protein
LPSKQARAAAATNARCPPHLTGRVDRAVSLLEASRFQCNSARYGHYGVALCFTVGSLSSYVKALEMERTLAFSLRGTYP